jgi:hypothetical protein
MLLLFMFATAVLAAFGLQALIERPREQGDAWRLVAAAAGIGLIGMVALGPSGGELATALGDVVGGLGKASPQTPGLTSVWCWLIAVGGVAAALLVLRARPKAALAVAGCLVALAALDMLHFANHYQPMVAADRAAPARTNAIRYLERHAADQRIAGVNLALPPDVPTHFRLRDARGYDAPQPSLRFYRLWQLASPRQEGWQPFDVRELTPAALNVLSVLGARLIVLEPSSATGALGVTQVYDGPDATVVRNRRALPRVFLARSVRVVADERAALATIATAAFDPRRTALLERGTPGAAALARAGARGFNGFAHIESEQNAKVVVKATLLQPGLLVLDDSFSPGWSVTVDGQPARAVRVDSVLRGLVMPVGTHVVTWSYTVPGLHAGLVLSGVGAVAMLGWWLLVQPRRAPPPPGVPSPDESRPPRRRRR